MRKVSSIIMFLILLVTVLVPEISANKFPDLPDWAKDEITYLNKEDVVQGFPNGKFGSSKSIKRGDAALMLVKAKGLDVTGDQGVSPFRDLQNKELYYYKAVLAATEAGYLSGFPDGTFRPNSTLTREQMAKIISTAYDFKGKNGTSFTDTSNSWAKREIESLADSGITVGLPDGSFKPKSNITRAEFSVMLARAMDDKYKVDPLKNMNVHFIDVGQGDSVLIQTPDGANILIDAGIKSAGEKVVSFLKSKDVGKLDLVIATHPHADHIGGLISVLNTFQVDKFVDSGKSHTTQTYLELLQIIDAKNIPFEVPRIGQVYSFDNNFKMTVLHVDSKATNLNNASVAVRAEYGDVSFMLTGDAEVAAEQQMVNSGFNLKSTILKAGHHGSNSSSIQAFLNKVKPSATILSYGKGNQYGHPHSEVVNRLRALGSNIYSTADSGNITVLTNGATYSISAKAMEKPVPVPPKPVPPKPVPPKPTPPKPDPGVSQKININKATAAQLEGITGVGPVIAQRIVSYRNANGKFKKLDDLKKVKGIGNVTYQKMRSQIRL